jgi:hypothetical protein
LDLSDDSNIAELSEESENAVAAKGRARPPMAEFGGALIAAVCAFARD